MRYYPSKSGEFKFLSIKLTRMFNKTQNMPKNYLKTPIVTNLVIISEGY